MDPDATTRPAAHERAIRHVASLSSGPPLDPGLRVTLNFHPDRPAACGTPILERLAEDGVYRSQFATGTSNGGLTAYPGGDRWRWESRMFAGAYDDEPAHARPVYGALNFRHRPTGGAPRFGSAHFRLTREVLARTTFCYPDSFHEPTDVGVAAAMPLIGPASPGTEDPLDDYIEAQVHAPVTLAAHVEALVLDPSHRGTPVETAARRLPCPIEWHPGFTLTTDELRRHPAYRGPQFVSLAAEIAHDGHLTPHILGTASHTGRHDPQSLKRVWHYLACFGAPAPRESPKSPV